MSNLIADLNSTNAFFRKDAERVANNLRNEATITNGIIRWNSNNAVPPTDCLELAAHIGLNINLAACMSANRTDTDAFLAKYRSAPIDEETRAEARAAHGPGVELVNLVTGHRWTT